MSANTPFLKNRTPIKLISLLKAPFVITMLMHTGHEPVEQVKDVDGTVRISAQEFSLKSRLE